MACDKLTMHSDFENEISTSTELKKFAGSKQHWILSDARMILDFAIKPGHTIVQ